ncbi:putative methyltransferase-domain-containing protein [Mrakia frigida]|uniref:putative methyltransferase-domain-containing protein n=1 Tax=Mrakia frigida TaxID=29902 RepID=UPI003FCC1007
MTPSTTSSDPLLSLLHQYASLQPLHQLVLPSSLLLARSQPWIVDNLLLNPQLVRYPPTKEYRRGFLKALVGRLEDGCREADEEEELEILEAILDVYVESLQSTSTDSSLTYAPNLASAPGASYKTFFFPLPSSPTMQGLVTLKEEQSIIQGGTTGLRTWIASLRLAEYLLARYSNSPFPSRVLELGSGIGFLGVLVAKLMEGSRDGELLLTDFDERVLDGLRDNLKLNELPIDDLKLRVDRLDWSYAQDEEAKGAVKEMGDQLDVELIFAADVAYDPVLGPPLVATLRLLLEPSASSPSAFNSSSFPPKRRTALVATTIRNPTTFEAFISQARSSGLKVTDLELPMEQVFWGCGEGGSEDATVRLIQLELDHDDTDGF